MEDESASLSLRKQIVARYPVVARKPAPQNRILEPIAQDEGAFTRPQPAVSDPPYRRVRVYAVDPSLSTRLETAAVNEVAIKIHWKSLRRAPSENISKSSIQMMPEKPMVPWTLTIPACLPRTAGRLQKESAVP